MRFHVISLPHTQVTDAYSACAFTDKVRKFCKMMKKLGHTVYLYAGEENEAPCDELITCISEPERAALSVGKHYSEASFDYSLPSWVTFNQNVIDGIKVRAQPRDFICCMAGLANKQVADAFPEMMFVEFGIGYGGNFAKYRVWESYAWMHLCYGAQNPQHNPNAVDGHFYDAVIPGYFERERFPFSIEKEDYYLFIGRLTERKGFQIAADVCERLGKRLIIAGQGTPPSYGEYVGVVGPEQRGELMRKATAVFAPTTYIEPFGNVVSEAMACGTPAITTDWGAFTETVVEGKTGFRCRNMAEFMAATENVKTLDPFAIRQHAVDNYSCDVIGPKYDKYFKRLGTLWGKGLYEERLP
jgi:hypothetical protein